MRSEELDEATYDGPSALLTAANGDVYIHDPWPERLQRFARDGKFQTGVEFRLGSGEPEVMVWGPSGPEGEAPIMFPDDTTQHPYPCISRLDRFDKVPGPARVTHLLKGTIAPGTSILRVGAADAANLLVEERGDPEEMPHVRHCERGDSLVKTLHVTDLVYGDGCYYALAVDCRKNALYKNPDTGAVMVQQIDTGADGCVVQKEIPITLPQASGKTLRWRWHLLGAGGSGHRRVFYFSTEAWISWGYPGEVIHAASEKGEVIGTVKVAAPGGEDAGLWLRGWRHLISVAPNGDLYLAIPTKKGIAIVRYANPVAPTAAP